MSLNRGFPDIWLVPLSPELLDPPYASGGALRAVTSECWAFSIEPLDRACPIASASHNLQEVILTRNWSYSHPSHKPGLLQVKHSTGQFLTSTS